jgi:cytochrome c-type biogenesis protein CcmE
VRREPEVGGDYNLGVARRGSPARLIVALSVAAVLAVFLLYTSIAGGGTPSLVPSKAAGHSGRISVGGVVVGKPAGDAHASGLRFRMRDPKGTATIPVVFKGSVPDLFRTGREVVADGKLRNGVLVADTLLTKCPSKYSPKK